MLNDAESIQELIEFFAHKRARIETLDDGRRFFIDGAGEKAVQIRLPSPHCQRFTTLDALTDFSKLEVGGRYFHVQAWGRVLLAGAENADLERPALGSAAIDLPDFVLALFGGGVTLKPSELTTLLLTDTEPTEDRATLLQVLGTIRQEEARVDEDDGVTAKVTHTQGVARLGVASIPPVLTLASRCVIFPDMRDRFPGGYPIRCVIRITGGNPKATPSVYIRAADHDFEHRAIAEIVSYLKDRTDLPVLG